ncbi:MAG TPA: PP2C family protein-serine/threonine phosphatase [Candidatus Acidoferrum sp.]|jgi:hypothetical protein
MTLHKSFLATMPRNSLLIFLLGVFFLFATIALAGDISEMGRQPVPRLILSLLVTSVFAVLYATAGFALRGQSWKVIVPVFIVHFFVLNAINSWLPSLPPLTTMDAGQVSWLRSRLGLDSLGIILSMSLGYACLLYASIIEARRYFRVHAEIALAHEIHQVLVPAIETKFGGFEFYGRSLPSGEVGGDLIDLAGTNEKWVAYLADVSGHGVAPGVVMSMAKSASRMLLRSGEATEQLMPRLNEVLYPLKKPDMFITFCFLAANENRLRVGLAGHPSILQYSPNTNQVIEIPCPNMPLGILPEGEFVTSEVTAESGTLFALYTDGFLEVANKSGEEFGMNRLKSEFLQHANQPLEAVYHSLKNAVSRHGPQFDDQSILLIRKL